MTDETNCKFKTYGSFDGEGFRMEVHGFFRLQSSPFDDEILQDLDRRERQFPGWKSDFIQAFRLFLRDSKLTMAQKAYLYADGYLTEEKAIEHFKKCWSLIAPNEPWPLDAHTPSS